MKKKLRGTSCSRYLHNLQTKISLPPNSLISRISSKWSSSRFSKHLLSQMPLLSLTFRLSMRPLKFRICLASVQSSIIMRMSCRQFNSATRATSSRILSRTPSLRPLKLKTLILSKEEDNLPLLAATRSSKVKTQMRARIKWINNRWSREVTGKVSLKKMRIWIMSVITNKSIGFEIKCLYYNLYLME